MDLAYLEAIGFEAHSSVIHLSLKRASGQVLVSSLAAPRDFDAHFPSSGKKSMIQKELRLPHRPPGVSDLETFLSWIEEEMRKHSDLATVQGVPEWPDLATLGKMVAHYGNDVALLDKELAEAATTLRDCFCSSDLCEALMRDKELWNLGLISDIFVNSVAKVPMPICGNARYTQHKWVQEYDGSAFLSIDMREANCSALRTMAMLADPALHEKLRHGWAHLLDTLLGARADLVRPLKPLREIVLGGLERAWLRRQADLRDVKGVSTRLAELRGDFFLRCALGDEPLSQEQATECNRTFKQLRGRISNAYTAVEHSMIEHIAAASSTIDGLQFFARCGDEAIFLLRTRSATEASAAAVQVSKRIQTSFTDDYQELASLFRVETFLVRDLGQDLSTTCRAMVALTRRLLPSGKWETFPKVKGVKSGNLELLSNSLRATRNLHCDEWESWLASDQQP